MPWLWEIHGMRALFVSSMSLVSLLSLSGCGAEQSATCAGYVECAAHYDAVFEIDPPTDTTPYGEGGDCWSNAQVAEQCDAQCGDAVASLRAALLDAGEDTGPCGG